MMAYPTGPNGALVKTNLENVINSFGTGFSISSFTWDKAVAMAQSLGGQLLDTKIMSVAGKTVAGVGAVTSAGTFYMGISDGSGFTWSDYGKNAILVGLSVTSVALTFLASSPVVVFTTLGVSAASLIISFVPNSVFGQPGPC